MTPTDPLAIDDDVRTAAGPGYAGEWGLFLDYTTATGQPALPTTVAALVGFLTALPARPATRARRVRAIAAAHSRAGHLLDRPDTGPAAPAAPPARWRPDPGLMIAACPTRGWPHGLAGRRDGFLVVLTEVLELPDARARDVRANDITVTDCPAVTNGTTGLEVGGEPVPGRDDPRTCPACAVVRWLDILGLADSLGRGSARMTLAAAHAPTAESTHQHVPERPARWRGASVLLPAIDRHGWHEDYRPMTTRAIRTRVALARTRIDVDAPSAPAPTAPPAGDESVHGEGDHAPDPATPELHEALELLEGLADDADALNARIEALLRS